MVQPARHPSPSSHSVGGRKRPRGDCRGFSLIELLVALFILAFSMLGLLSMALTSSRVNLENDIRNTSIRLTNEMAEIFLTQPINNVVSGTLNPYDATNPALLPDFRHYPNPSQTVRGFTQAYNVSWTVTTLTNDLRQIAITVQYTHRGKTYSNNAVIYKHRAI